jgi:NADH-quinone oxidoreductase subunit H
MGGKIVLSLFLMMCIRWTLPRFRFDQLMRLAWKGLIPMTLGLFVLTVALLYVGDHRSPVWTLIGNVVIATACLWMASRRRVEVTGRQVNLPPMITRAGPMSKLEAGAPA